ncbi:hypothetical protein RLIN73S_06924 [Rhodanobacter lindaniclasticus]
MGDRLEAQLVAGIGGVGDQLAQDDLLARVQTNGRPGAGPGPLRPRTGEAMPADGAHPRSRRRSRWAAWAAPRIIAYAVAFVTGDGTGWPIRRQPGDSTAGSTWGGRGAKSERRGARSERERKCSWPRGFRAACSRLFKARVWSLLSCARLTSSPVRHFASTSPTADERRRRLGDVAAAAAEALPPQARLGGSPPGWCGWRRSTAVRLRGGRAPPPANRLADAARSYAPGCAGS